MLEVICKGCGKKYNAPEKFAGRKMSCKACSEVMLIGEEAAPETSSPSPAEEEVAQAPGAPAQEESTGKKPPFKKGGISSRTGGKKPSFKKGAISSSKPSDVSPSGSGDQAAGSKKSPAKLLVVLLLVVGGLAAVDFFVTNKWLGGKAPTEGATASVEDEGESAESEDPAASDPVEPGVAEAEKPGGGDEPAEEPVTEPVEEATSLAEISATASPIASLVPADAQALLGLNVPRLIAAVEGITGEKIPREPEILAAMLAGLGEGAPVEPLKKAMAAGLDPFSIQRVLVVVAGDSLDSEVGGMVLIEGEFTDPAAIVSAFVESGALSPSAPEVKGGLNLYLYSGAESLEATRAAVDLVGDTAKLQFAFLSTGQMMVASADWFDKVIALRKGEGKAIDSNELFNSLSQGLARKEALWLVAAIPEKGRAILQEGLPPPRTIAGPDGETEAPTPAIKIDTLSLAVDSGGKDFSLELIGITPSPEDAENTKNTIGTQIGGMSLMAMQMFGLKAAGLMGKLNPKSDGNNVIISFTLNEKDIATITEMATKAFTGFEGGGGEEAVPVPIDPSDFIEKPGEPAVPSGGIPDLDDGDVDDQPVPEEAESPADSKEPGKEAEGGEDDPLELDDF